MFVCVLSNCKQLEMDVYCCIEPMNDVSIFLFVMGLKISFNKQ